MYSWLMNIEIKKIQLTWSGRLLTPTHGLMLLPEQHLGRIALLCHGYTSHKGSLLAWATRLAEEKIPTMIFDVPGHYLGNFSEVDNFSDFKSSAHELFQEAYEQALLELNFAPERVILGGHSLGALLALKALDLSCFSRLQKIAIGVGLGMPPQGVVHIFDTPFYKSTLKLREGLVSPALKPDNVFPWIKEEKENLAISQKRIHLISGEDDMVVGEDGMERFAKHLEKYGNDVSIEKPKRLAHHVPENAAPHIKKFLKDQGWLE
ncbi:MAG: hypothetical protein CME71_00220 [Halobacteriovorax sp.]|nr:hypothetical protein [Halobacteriovorax sp.]